MMDWDYDKWRFLFDLLVLAGLVVHGVYTWVMNGSKANQAAIDQVGEDVSGVKRRLDVLETEVSHLPDHSDLGTLHEKVNQVASVMGEMKGEMHGISRTLTLMHESMLQERNPR